MTTPAGPEPIFIRPGDRLRKQTGCSPGEDDGILAGLVSSVYRGSVLPALLLQTK